MNLVLALLFGIIFYNQAHSSESVSHIAEIKPTEDQEKAAKAIQDRYRKHSESIKTSDAKRRHMDPERYMKIQKEVFSEIATERSNRTQSLMKEITYLSEHINFQKSLYPSLQVVADWLAYEGLIPKKIHVPGKDYSKNIEIKFLRDTGTANDGIYLVYRKIQASENESRSIPIFILKFVKSMRTTENIELQIAEQSILYKINSFDPNMPKITYSEKLGFYKAPNDTAIYVQLLHAGRGVSFANIIYDWIDNRDQNEAALTEAFTLAGKSIGHLHKTFLKKVNDQYQTIIHGDLHVGNILLDLEKKKIVLIDNNQARNANPLNDLVTVITHILFFGRVIFEDEGSDFVLKAVRPFLKAYLDNYDPEYQKYIQTNLSYYLSDAANIYVNHLRPIMDFTPRQKNLMGGVITECLSLEGCNKSNITKGMDAFLELNTDLSKGNIKSVN